MNKFEQSLQRRLRNPEFAEGYREMPAEIQRLQASAGLGNDFDEHGPVHGSGSNVMRKQGEDDCRGQGGKCH